MVASMMKPGEAVVVISQTGATRSIIDTARGARARCAVIGLVGSKGPLLEHCDVVILAETLDNTDIYTPTISRIAALAVIDIISTAIALRRGEDQSSASAA